MSEIEEPSQIGQKSPKKNLIGNLKKMILPKKRIPPPPVPHREEVLAIRNKFPNKIPVVIERLSKNSNLPKLAKSKYLVPQEITMSQFQTIIRNRIKMLPSQALYLMVNNRSMLSLSLTLAEVYSEFAGPDGYLYVTYTSQEVFGADNK